MPDSRVPWSRVQSEPSGFAVAGTGGMENTSGFGQTLQRILSLAGDQVVQIVSPGGPICRACEPSGSMVIPVLGSSTAPPVIAPITIFPSTGWGWPSPTPPSLVPTPTARRSSGLRSVGSSVSWLPFYARPRGVMPLTLAHAGPGDMRADPEIPSGAGVLQG